MLGGFPATPSRINVNGTTIGLYITNSLINPLFVATKSIVHITGDKKNPALVINLNKCSKSRFIQLSGANIIPTPNAKTPDIKIATGTKTRYMVGLSSATIIIGMMTRLLNRVILTLDSIATHGKITLGK